MQVSIIIPCHNHADFVRNAVDSALRQRVDAEVSVIVVDDGSTDASPDILFDISAEEPRLRVLTQRRAGPAAARNAGLAALRDDCEVVAFLDSDDLMPPDRLARDLPRLQADPGLDFTYGAIRLVDALDYVSGQPTRAARTRNVTALHVASALFRRSFLDRIGGFDTDFLQGEDTDFLLRAFEASGNFAQTSTICANVLKHDGNMMNNSAAARRGHLMALQRSVARRREAGAHGRFRRPDFTLQPLAELRLS